MNGDATTSPSTIGVLASGGLDSCILTAHLLRQGRRVQPFYVRCGLFWEREELSALHAFLGDCSNFSAGKKGTVPLGRLEELLVFDLPLADLYGSHWSIDGRDTPDAQSADEAVYLPGRNALLAVKPALWCGMHGVKHLALAVLAGNPFADATEEFFRTFEAMLCQTAGRRLEILRPFALRTKAEVVQLGAGLPLDRTFSCIHPIDGLHCGRCNKCAERRRAFAAAGMEDKTNYRRD
jgi:7-cyano-7-deazaguanine synthase